MDRRWTSAFSELNKRIDSLAEIVINIDGIGPVPQSLIEEARDELAKLLVEQCKAKLTTNYIDKDNREIDTNL